jgi:hypothetical protein
LCYYIPDSPKEGVGQYIDRAPVVFHHHVLILNSNFYEDEDAKEFEDLVGGCFFQGNFSLLSNLHPVDSICLK